MTNQQPPQRWEETRVHPLAIPEIDDLSVAVLVHELEQALEAIDRHRNEHGQDATIDAIRHGELGRFLSERQSLVAANQAAVELFGARDFKQLREEFGRTDASGTGHGYREYFAKVAMGLDQIEQDNVHRKMSGETIHIRVRSTLLRSNDPPIIITTIMDVTDYVELQKQLSETERRQRVAIEASRLGIWELNIADGMIDFDAGYHALLGYTNGSLSGSVDKYKSLLHPDDYDWSFKLTQRMCSGEAKSLEKTNRLLCVDGTFRWFHCRGEVCERDEEGRPLKAIGSLNDVHAEVTSQQLLELERESLGYLAAQRTLLDSLSFFAKGIERVWDHVRCAINLYNHTTDTFHIGAAPSLGEMYLEAVEGLPLASSTTVCGKAVRTRQFAHFADLSEVPELAEMMPFYDGIEAKGCWSFPIRSGDQVIATCCLFTRAVRSPTELEIQQISRLAQTAGLLIEADKHAREKADFQAQVHTRDRLEGLGKMAGGIAHDFNNLLTVVRTNAELIEGMSSGHARQCAAQIQNASRIAAELCKKMLTYAGSAPFQLKALDLSDVVSEVSRIIESGSPVGVKFDVRVQDDLPPTVADRALISQMIMNLVTNAVESLDGSGHVEISTGEIELVDDCMSHLYLNEGAKPGRYVYVRVTDDGQGIDPATQAKIFDPFFSTKPDGRGLGLATVFGAVTRHEGGLGFRSSPGHGSEFTVYLPVSTSPVLDQLDKEKSVQVPMSRRCVAVIEDEDAVRSVVESLLRLKGFEVVSFASGDQAIAKLDQLRDCDAVVLDQQMPGRSGLETYRAIREVMHEVPVCFISGYTRSEEVSTVVHGDDLCTAIDKPFGTDELLSAIQGITTGI